MAENDLQEVNLKQFIKIVAATKQMTITETAKASGREQSTLSNMLSRGNTNIKVLSEVLEGLGEDLVLCTANGQKFKITV